MRRYAADTSISAEDSKREIEEMLRRYGANSFTSGWNEDAAMVAFQLHKLTIRFILPVPDRAERRFSIRMLKRGSRKLTTKQGDAAYEQEICSRWRALLLVIKAKLEAVEIGITTLENEFMAFIVLPNGGTMGKWILDTAIPMIREGKMPMPLLPEHIPDAEIK